jgi:hypothetical protein
MMIALDAAAGLAAGILLFVSCWAWIMEGRARVSTPGNDEKKERVLRCVYCRHVFVVQEGGLDQNGIRVCPVCNSFFGEESR